MADQTFRIKKFYVTLLEQVMIGRLATMLRTDRVQMVAIMIRPLIRDTTCLVSDSCTGLTPGPHSEG